MTRQEQKLGRCRKLAVRSCRAYRWNGEVNGQPRAWWIDVPHHAKSAELAFLQGEIYQREIDLLVREVTVYGRYSDRC